MATMVELNPRAFDKFVAATQQDPRQKTEVISNILHNGLAQVLEQSFTLTDRQKAEVDLLKRQRDIEDFVGRAFIMGLVHNAPLKLIHEGHPQPNLWMRFEVGPGGFSFSAGC